MTWDFTCDGDAFDGYRIIAEAVNKELNILEVERGGQRIILCTQKFMDRMIAAKCPLRWEETRGLVPVVRNGELRTVAVYADPAPFKYLLLENMKLDEVMHTVRTAEVENARNRAMQLAYKTTTVNGYR